MPIRTERLTLTPLRAADADEMFAVLDDPSLHAYIGGEPSSLEELTMRYARLEAGGGHLAEGWVNLVVRRRADGAAIGVVQATIDAGTDPTARIAWIIGAPWQRHGYATEAADALVAWLRRQGIDRIQAYIRPDHEASMGVARRLGMRPTDVQHDGETRWETPHPA